MIDIRTHNIIGGKVFYNMHIYNCEKNGELRVQPFYRLEEISIFIYIITKIYTKVEEWD